MRKVEKEFPVARLIHETRTSIGEKILAVNENWEEQQAEIFTVFLSIDDEQLSQQSYVARGSAFDLLMSNTGKNREDQIWQVVDMIQANQ
ncbi:hypothetical protein D5F11_021750 [Siminovitchia terrae]|uniref:Uncharacterized protein n=1 Tax=Siminovitchia terrae TaxID=1914933 RepID=A0A429X2T6_SIMTE|nr:hypothetical protein [Siminovitchia terrae]RST57687.1 hypothetical protein D5F11_021750 [Siminovitchia terrae]